MGNATFISEDEYLIREPQADYKNEYRDGRVVAMSGASLAHNRITRNLAAALHRELRRKPCEAFVSDMRVKVAAAHFYTYPDVSVVCGEPKFDPKDKLALINPVVIIEVLSASTADYDRGEKFSYYQKLSSLQEYVLIDAEKVGVTHYTFDGEAWTCQEFCDPQGSLFFSSIDCRIPLATVYENVL